MGHNIELMADGRSAMAYNAKGGKPWHFGMINTTEAIGTIDAMMEAAQLNWTVETRPLPIVIPDGNGGWSADFNHPTLFETNKKGETKYVGRYGIFRTLDDRCYGEVSGKYKPAQNRELFALGDELLGRGAEVETAMALGHGERIVACFRLPETITVGGDSSETIQNYLVVYAGHDGKFGIHVANTPIRAECHNTVNAAFADKRSRTHTFKHMGSEEVMARKLSMIREILDLNKFYMEKLKERAEELLNVNFNLQAWDELCNVLVPKPAENASAILVERREDKFTTLFNRIMVPNLENIKSTGWGAFNAVADYTSHFAAGPNVDKEVVLDTIVEGHPLLDKALEHILEYAGIS